MEVCFSWLSLCTGFLCFSSYGGLGDRNGSEFGCLSTLCCLLYRSLFDVFWESVGEGNALSLYQGLGTKNLQSVISQFIYFYSYSLFKQWYLARAKVLKMGTGTNLLVAAAAGTCTAVLTQVCN